MSQQRRAGPSIPSVDLQRYLPVLDAAVSQLQQRARDRRGLLMVRESETLLGIVGELKALRMRIEREERG